MRPVEEDAEDLARDQVSITTWSEEDTLVVHLWRGLDFSTAHSLIHTAGRLSQRTVIFDLCRLTFIDSVSLDALRGVMKSMEEVGRTVSIRGAHGLVRRVIEVTDLVKVLDE